MPGLAGRALLFAAVSPLLALGLAFGCGNESSQATGVAAIPEGGIFVPVLSDASATDGGTSSELEDGGTATMQGLLSQLQAAVATNLASYDQVDLTDLEDVLTDALLIAQSPGGRGALSSQCVVQATQTFGFSASQAVTLCRNDLFDSAGCAAKAVQTYGFDRDAAVTLCATRGSTETADCAQSALVTLGFTRAQAVSLCADRDGTDAAACAASAIGTGGFDREDALSLCAHRGTTITADCASAAVSTLAFARSEAVTLCANRGSIEAVTCATNATRSFGFTQAQALTLCANRGQPGGATCANTLINAAITRDQAVAACR